MSLHAESFVTSDVTNYAVTSLDDDDRDIAMHLIISSSYFYHKFGGIFFRRLQRGKSKVFLFLLPPCSSA